MRDDHARTAVRLNETPGASIEARRAIEEGGYRWLASRRFWRPEVLDESLDDDVAWATAFAYEGGRRLTVRHVAVERYAAVPVAAEGRR